MAKPSVAMCNKVLRFIGPDRLNDSVTIVSESRLFPNRTFCERILRETNAYLIYLPLPLKPSRVSETLEQMEEQHASRFCRFETTLYSLFTMGNLDYNWMVNKINAISEHYRDAKHVNLVFVPSPLALHTTLSKTMSVISNGNPLLAPGRLNLFASCLHREARNLIPHDYYRSTVSPNPVFWDILDIADSQDRQVLLHLFRPSVIAQQITPLEYRHFLKFVFHARQFSKGPLIEHLEKIVPGVSKTLVLNGISPMHELDYYHPRDLLFIYRMLRNSDCFRNSILESVVQL